MFPSLIAAVIIYWDINRRGWKIIGFAALAA